MRSLVLDALVPIRTTIVGAFVPVVCVVLAPVTVAVFMRGRCGGALVAAGIADHICIIVIEVCFRYPALVRRGAIFICADAVVASFTIGGPVAVGVLVDWRCDGALVAANIAGCIRVISVGVCGFVLDALGLLRAAIVGAFVPVARAVLAPIVVAVLVGGRRDDALVTANIADVRSCYVRSIAEFSSGCIRVIGVDGVDVRGLVLDAFVPIRAISIRAFMPVTRVIPAPVAIVVLMGGRRDGALVTANIAGHIRVISVDVRSLVRDAFVPLRAAIIGAFAPVVCVVLTPVTVGVLVDWRCDGALVTANIAGRIRVISVDVCGFVLDALGLLRAAIVGAFVPVVCVVLAPVAIGVLVDWRCDGALVAAGIADRICIIVIDVCFRYPALVCRGAIFICADAVVSSFTIGDPVAVGVLVDWRCDGALIAANIAGRIRVISVDVCGFVLDALGFLRAAIVGAFVPVTRAVLDPITVTVLVRGRVARLCLS